MNKTKFVFLIFIFLKFNLAFAERVLFEPLDPDYEDIIIVFNDLDHEEKNLSFSDWRENLGMQSSVKSQGRRGTCSIFSSVGLLESYLIRDGLVEKNIDLSEEWAQFLAMKGKTNDGYWSYRSWYNIFNHGIVKESSWPYDPTVWDKKNLSELGEARCGHLAGEKLDSCALGHRDHHLLDAKDEELLDPSGKLYDEEFFNLREEAISFKESTLDGYLNAYSFYPNLYRVYGVSEVRENLRNGISMTLSVPFFYGAWNHGKASTLGMKRNMELWYQGIVGYPEKKSHDHFVSRKEENRAGHSVVVIGYDDDIEIKTTQLMIDGTHKEFIYKGAYIFKNSWGIKSFGLKNQVSPGYGYISQKYVHQYGGFYRLY